MAEWLNATDLSPLLHAVRQLSSERKLRLFMCACARHFFPANPHPDLYRGVEMAEQMADGTASLAITESVRGLFGSLVYFGDYEARGFAGENMASATFIRHAVNPRADQAARGTSCYLSDYDADMGFEKTQTGVPWFRDILGNPFHPVAFSSDWHTDTSLALARQAYESRDFTVMPILADALQDAGCDNADVLDHCRGPGPHVRGCWVVDAILGKA
jgi:hypothetical protein